MLDEPWSNELLVIFSHPYPMFAQTSSWSWLKCCKVLPWSECECCSVAGLDVMQNNRVQSSVTVWIASGFSVLTAVVVRFFFRFVAGSCERNMIWVWHVLKLWPLGFFVSMFLGQLICSRQEKGHCKDLKHRNVCKWSVKPQALKKC